MYCCTEEIIGFKMLKYYILLKCLDMDKSATSFIHHISIYFVNYKLNTAVGFCIDLHFRNNYSSVSKWASKKFKRSLHRYICILILI